jgi:hypothetical protein
MGSVAQMFDHKRRVAAFDRAVHQAQVMRGNALVKRISELLSGEPVTEFETNGASIYVRFDMWTIQRQLSTGEAFAVIANKMAEARIEPDWLTRAVVLEGKDGRSCIVEYQRPLQ